MVSVAIAPMLGLVIVAEMSQCCIGGAYPSRVSRTNFKIYMKYIFAVTHETAGAEDSEGR